jgi:hypothetical protein
MKFDFPFRAEIPVICFKFHKPVRSAHAGSAESGFTFKNKHPVSRQISKRIHQVIAGKTGLATAF